MEAKRFRKCEADDKDLLQVKLEWGFGQLPMTHVRIHLVGNNRVWVTPKERFLDFIKSMGEIKGSAQILLDAYDTSEVDFAGFVTNMLPTSLDSYNAFFKKDGASFVRKVTWSGASLWIDHRGVIDGEEPCSLVNQGKTWNLSVVSSV